MWQLSMAVVGPVMQFVAVIEPITTRPNARTDGSTALDREYEN